MKKTILIVDDSPEDRAIYRRFLLKKDHHAYNIIEEDTGEEALIRCNSVQPDLILLDYILPDFDGLEFIEYLKQQIAKLPPVIMLTGQGDEIVAVDAIKAGIRDYLVKGKLTEDVLNLAVNNAFKQHSLYRKLSENKQEQQLIAETALRIRQHLKLQDILDVAVSEVQNLLNCDRVLIYSFDSELNGIIVAEAVKLQWQKTLGTKVIDTCFKTNQFRIDKYKQGKIQAIDNVHTARLSQCYLALLTEFKVKANLVVPILTTQSVPTTNNNCLWGLLIAHCCHSPHQWQKEEIELLKKLSVQLAIAIQQAELINKLEEELAQRKLAEIEMKKAKLKLHQANLNLEQRIEERTRKLSRATKIAENANKAKDIFIAHMSHELRTPLNSIIGFSSILQKASQLTPQQLNSVNIVHQSGLHLLTLINDLLDFSKLTENEVRITPQEFNFVQFLTEIAQVFQLRAREKALEFKLNITSSIPTYVKTDPTRLRQVLYNLLSNAIKFTDLGSITLTVGRLDDFEAAQTDAQIYEADPSSNCCLIRFQVDDTGIGIPSNQLADIFAPYRQLNDVTRNREGTGLGLTISHKILQLMNSQIHVESQLNRGSKFWFDLEFLEIKKNNLSTLPGFSDLHPHLVSVSSKILVVDDNDANRTLLLRYLEPLGFILAEAKNGQEGLTVAQTFQPDAILVDFVMPVMDGKEMIAKIRQQPQFQEVVIIVISANSQLVFQNSEIDCQGFLPKPVNQKELLDLLTTNLKLDWQRKPLSEESNNLSTLVAPPEEILVKLLKLAQFGDLSAIEVQISCLRSLDKKYIPFVEQVTQLITTCQRSELESLIRKYMK